MSLEDDDDTLVQRQDAEVSLLQAMYPDNIDWNAHRRELKYKSQAAGILVLRLPDQYPEKGPPELISALTQDKTDLRKEMKAKVLALHFPENEEILDAQVQAFEEVVNSMHAKQWVSLEPLKREDHQNKKSPHAYKTVVIWLHHLLNTNKRKLATHPSFAVELVSGVTKPGYPGIMLFSGDFEAVDAHVAELRSQKWQAFQVRFEQASSSSWAFSTTTRIAEVESMSEVVQSILEPSNREAFVKCIGIK